MVATPHLGSRARGALANAETRRFALGLAALSLLGLWCRLAGLTSGSLYRDDAWVALTSRVPWHDAWRMVGTAPGFVLFERFWVHLDASTAWAQAPTLVASILAIPLVGLVARWWGLSRSSALVCAALIAVSRVDVQYATHLKPYAHDLIAGALVLAGAQWWRRGSSGWVFAAISLVCLATSFSVAPVVVGCGLVMGVEAIRTKRVGGLVGPGALLILPIGALYFAVRAGISPRLRQSWAPNFVSFHSLHDVVHSTYTIIDGLVWGFADTTPHLHVPGISKVVIAFVLIMALAGAARGRQMLLPTASVLAAALFAVAHVAPLGTGRTDAYLYPALALLVAAGVESTVSEIARHHRTASRVALGAVIALVGFTALDVATHRPSYPGGSIVPVAAAARTEIANHGGVIIEGTARWPWTYYEVPHVKIRFSNLYNTGFAPVNDQPHVFIMPGTVIEGGYDPRRAVRAMGDDCSVLYVRTDDWPTLGDPLRAALAARRYRVVRFEHTPGYLLEWLRRPCGAV